MIFLFSVDMRHSKVSFIQDSFCNDFEFQKFLQFLVKEMIYISQHLSQFTEGHKVKKDINSVFKFGFNISFYPCEGQRFSSPSQIRIFMVYRSFSPLRDSERCQIGFTDFYVVSHCLPLK